MVNPPNALWLSVSPSLHRFDRNLLQVLTRSAEVSCWRYRQTPDEPCSLEAAVELLHGYIQQCDRPVHLLGHSTSGILGLLYARRYPERLQSLTLLSVSASPAMNWHSQYYALRNLLPCSRSMLLAHLSSIFFNARGRAFTTALAESLAKDLDTGLGLHSPAGYDVLPAGGVRVPLLVCRGAWDPIIDAEEGLDWQPWFKSGDLFWSCPDGKHFFHHEHPEAVGAAIGAFWQAASSMPPRQQASRWPESCGLCPAGESPRSL